MLDDQRLADSELCARVKVYSPELAALLGARLRRLRLGRVVTDPAAAQGNSDGPQIASSAPPSSASPNSSQ